VALWTAVLCIPIVLYILFSIKRPTPITGKTFDRGYYNPYITFETDWFMFRTDKNWEEVDELTTPDQVYTYRQKVGANPQGLLRIYVAGTDAAAHENFYTFVQPVALSEDGKTFDVRLLQEDCDAAVPKGNVTNSVRVSQGDTSFNCWIGGSVFYAVVGQVGGNERVKMKRTDGSSAEYIITYRNLAFTASESTLGTVLKTFTSK
jgi:hypothetical protein